MSGSMDSSVTATGIPAIRTLQFDSNSIGRLAGAVNLFRGHVNIPQTLFSLPSRQSDGGLDIDFTILYQSNVFQQAALWNRDSPTSVLGLGWSLPLTYIEATNTGSPDPDTRTYVLNDNGASNLLVRQPQQPFLFTISSSVTDGLQASQPVTAEVRDQFLQFGLPLDPAATATGSSRAWALNDDAVERCFIIQTSHGNSALCNVCYGGQAFQLKNYSFWHIVYFPMYERWLIITDDGIRKSFGGGLTTTPQGYRTSAGNSIAWQVWWTLNGIPAWTGPSSLTTGQVQLATAWYLASCSDPFGDTITYAYNGWARNSSGLIPDVEQQVGVGGLPYTKAVYLTQVTDVFGRTAALAYGDKLWDNTADDSPREYADPHRDVPSNDPNGYQDRYETKYLTSVALSALDGTSILTVQFGYNPRSTVEGPEQAVANVNNYPGTLQGVTFKRYLTSVGIQNGDGASLPGYQYNYYLDSSVSGAQPGALQMLTCPQGGQAVYTYQQQELTVCDREATVTRPTQTPNGTPRVFYGDNYVVSLWFDPTGIGILTLQVWTWYGRWISWQLNSAPMLELATGPFDSSSINVIANSQFFVVAFDSGANSVAYVFTRPSVRPGNSLRRF